MDGHRVWTSIRTRAGIPLDEVLSAYQKAVQRKEYDDARDIVLDAFHSGREGHIIGRIQMAISEDVGVASADMPQIISGLLKRVDAIR